LELGMLLTICNKSHGSVWRVVHHDAETPSDLNLPIATGSEYSVTEVTLSDNAEDPFSGATLRHPEDVVAS
jgi:hypothetical protein